jgi:hypothetical protein
MNTMKNEGYKNASSPLKRQQFIIHESCRGRDRTSTEQLAIAQCCGGQPQSGQLLDPALHYVYPVISTPETRGHVCQNSITPQYLDCFKELDNAILKINPSLLKFFQQKF